MPAIALATYAALPGCAADEQPLIECLAALGVHARPAVWDDASVPWHEYDGVVVRSCWDYHLRHDDFFSWVDRVTAAGVPIWNSPAVLRWSSRKTYLHDLEIGGVRTVPTVWLLADNARAKTASLATLLTGTGWERAVVKPIISASAHDTWSVTIDEARDDAGEWDARLRALIARPGAMVQPFVQEVESDGEWSLQFFGGVFSHAVRKYAALGDFRVTREWGGWHETVTPPPNVIRQAEGALRFAPGESVYARVDGFIVNGDFMLTELELLEPSLFLDADPAAPMRFAQAIAHRIKGVRVA